MSVQANVNCEVDAATGNDLNAGWFNSAGTSAGTDYTYSTGQTVINYTDLIIDATFATKVTSVIRAFISADVRNYLRIPAGVTGFTAGVYEIISVASGVATLSNSPGATSTVQTNGTIKLGGSLASITQAITDHVSGSQIFVKNNATPYTHAGINMKGGGTTIRGYNTTRGDCNVGNSTTLTRPVVRPTGSNQTLFGASSFACNGIENLDLDGNATTNCRGITIGQGGMRITNCRFRRWQNNAINGGSSGAGGFAPGIFTGCEIDSNTTATWAIIGQIGIQFIDCDIHGNTTTSGAIRSDGSSLTHCNIYANTGIGIQIQNNLGMGLQYCNIYGNSGNGVSGQGSYDIIPLYRCVVYGNSGWQITSGVSTAAVNSQLSLCECAYNTGGSGGLQGILSYNNYGSIVLTADPFVAGGSGNFAPNTTAGGGTLIKGIVAKSPAGTTTFYSDIGSSQHQDTGGGGGGGSQTAFAYVG